MRDSAVIYRNQFEAMQGLPADQFKAAMVAILKYAMDDETPGNDDPVVFGMWMMARPLIDKCNRNYENAKRRRTKSTKDDSETKANSERLVTEPLATCDRTVIEPLATEERLATERQPNGDLNVKCKMLNVKDKEKEEKKKGRFSLPTLQEVQDYIREKGYTVNADTFISFYESKNWYVGKTKMTDWKAALRGWQSREKKTPDKNRFNNFEPRQYDYEELERQLLAAQGG